MKKLSISLALLLSFCLGMLVPQPEVTAATLTEEQRLEIRREMARDLAEVDYDQPTINTAIQAVEDWFVNNRLSLNQAIDNATAPQVLTAQQKVLLVKYWLRSKFHRE